MFGFAFRFAPCLLVLTALVVLSCPSVFAQQSPTDSSTPTALARGTHPLGSYDVGGFDAVNLFNGNLSMRFPLAGKDGRAGHGVTVLLSYNSKIWRSDPTRTGRAGRSTTRSTTLGTPG